MNEFRAGELFYYKGRVVKYLRPSYSRFGNIRGTVEEISTKRKFVVNVEYLREIPEVNTYEYRP